MNAANTYHVETEEIISEEKIIEESKTNINAFSFLYDKYYLKIFRFIYNRVESEEIASDICSQVFLKALQSIKQYENRGLPYGSYLYRIARNEINQKARKNKITKIVSLKSSDIENIAEEIEFFETDYKTKLIKLLETLNENDMELIEMKYFEKRSYKEISEILNKNENNLKVKVHRIIKGLKKLI